MVATRLNPFEFRAGLKRGLPRVLRNVACLNPFEFRAGLKPPDSMGWSRITCLNPFEFRAGLKHKTDFAPGVDPVLIPLNSGLA